MPGRVPCPAITGRPPFAHSSATASSARYEPGGPDRQARRHEHPARRRIAVRGDLERLERVERIELGAAEHLGHPHLVQPVAVERFDDVVVETSLPVGVLAMLVDERHQRAGRLAER